MVVDALMQRLYRRGFDKDGKTALSGRANKDVVLEVMRMNYFRRPLPKSTGREEFGKSFTADLLKKCKGMSRSDIIATASIITPMAIADAVKRYSGMRVDDLIVSGGGAKNRFFLRTMREMFGTAVVRESGEFGIPGGEKEGICFAVLAFETVAGRSANLPSVTGARRRVVLGKICQP
jgi:anhydro-N-acetylmuramic acid kinase